jgi:hypothetical protein
LGEWLIGELRKGVDKQIEILGKVTKEAGAMKERIDGLKESSEKSRKKDNATAKKFGEIAERLDGEKDNGRRKRGK